MALLGQTGLGNGCSVFCWAVVLLETHRNWDVFQSKKQNRLGDG